MKHPATAPQPTATNKETRRCNVWANAMIEVAAETTANLDALPMVEREHARLWAIVLSDLARELLSDAPKPMPTLRDLPRPGA